MDARLKTARERCTSPELLLKLKPFAVEQTPPGAESKHGSAHRLAGPLQGEPKRSSPVLRTPKDTGVILEVQFEEC